MMTFEPENYKTLELLTFEEFKEDIIESLIGQRKLIEKYRELIKTNANPDKNEDYLERIERYGNTIVYNINVLERADIEKDYLIFYREDGHVGIEPSTPSRKKKVYERERRRKMLVV